MSVQVYLMWCYYCLQKCGYGKPAVFLSWALDPPLPTIIHRAMSLLTSIGACVEGETLTPLGHHLAALPVHVRIGKMLLYAAILGCLEPIVSICRVRRFHTSYPPVLSTHPIHPSYPPVLSTHPIHLSYPPILSTNPIHPSYPHVLSTHPRDTACWIIFAFAYKIVLTERNGNWYGYIQGILFTYATHLYSCSTWCIS